MALITNTYWPAFKQAVEDNPDGASSAELTCGICLETMDIRHPEICPDHLADHLARILPCGHIIGSTCLYKMLKGIKTDYYQCPTCKTRCHNHPKCGHQSGGQLLPAEVSEYSKVPPILSAGGRIPANCSNCETHCLLQELGSYRKVPDINEPAVGDNECLAFYLMAVGEQDLNKFSKDNHVGDRIRTVDLTEDMLAIWKIYQQSLAVKTSMFWYEFDLTKLRFESRLFEKNLTSKPRKRNFLLRILD